jgi:hypothetical protein
MTVPAKMGPLRRSPPYSCGRRSPGLPIPTRRCLAGLSSRRTADYPEPSLRAQRSNPGRHARGRGLRRSARKDDSQSWSCHPALGSCFRKSTGLSPLLPNFCGGPAEAGIQRGDRCNFLRTLRYWTPAFAGWRSARARFPYDLRPRRTARENRPAHDPRTHRPCPSQPAGLFPCLTCSTHRPPRRPQ